MLVVWSRQTRPATACLSYAQFNQLKLTPGAWILVQDEHQKAYCRVWPQGTRSDYIVADPYINVVQEPAGSAKDQLKPIEPKLAVQATLRLSVSPDVLRESQLDGIGCCYDDMTKLQKLSFVRNKVDNLLVSAGTTIKPASYMQIEVISTQPANVPVLLTTATHFTLDAEDMNQPNQVDVLATSMDKLVLEGKISRPIGLEKAYEALFEVVSYPLLYKDWIDKLHIECPKGVLLYGPPGVGKTFLVSSIANACHAQLFMIQGPEIYGPYIGESEERLRSKFEQAQEAAAARETPVILFIDEIDALTPNRDNAQSQENRIVAQLLTLMDGISSRGRLLVIGATNRPNSIDPALRRPGRFDREISIDVPNLLARQSLFETQLKHMPLDDTVNAEVLATTTNGFVAADIVALCREAAMKAVQRSALEGLPRMQISIHDFKSSLSVVGPSLQRGFQVDVDKTKWQDVGGLADVKKQLKQAVEWPLLYKDSFVRLGLKPPRGILLYGPPGCSKTTLVKVIASSSDASFFSINGAQLYSPFVGDSEKVIRITFQKARASAPSIIFLDEMEAIVGKRDLGNGGGQGGDSVQQRVLSTLLNEMDGVELAGSVLVVGATNRRDMLDAALLRPGRLDRLVYVPPPDHESRLEILQIHTRQMPLSPSVNLNAIAEKTDYYTGADLQNLCREAAMIALRQMRNVEYVDMSHFDQALSTVPPSTNPEMLEMYKQQSM